MRKKLKKGDWSAVYQHVRPRLQHEGRKKLRKPTAVLINGTKKPWDDVWKEIKRNNALSQRPRRGQCKTRTSSHKQVPLSANTSWSRLSAPTSYGCRDTNTIARDSRKHSSDTGSTIS